MSSCVRVYVNVSVCMFWILQYARCGMMPDMSRDAELHSCWAVNRDPYHPVLLSQHDKPLSIHCKISEEKNTRPAKSCKASSSHFFNIYSLNNIFLKSKSWYYAKNGSGSDKRGKGNLATQHICLYQKTSCSEINGASLWAVVWITRGSNNKKKNTLTGLTKPWRTSLVPFYPLMQL